MNLSFCLSFFRDILVVYYSVSRVLYGS